MTQTARKTVVCSWNEWDPLKHVIVSRADGTMIQAPEIAVERDWPEDGFPLGKYGPYPQEMVDAEKILQGIKTELIFLVYSFPWYSNNYRLSPWKRRGSLQYG